MDICPSFSHRLSQLTFPRLFCFLCNWASRTEINVLERARSILICRIFILQERPTLNNPKIVAQYSHYQGCVRIKCCVNKFFAQKQERRYEIRTAQNSGLWRTASLSNRHNLYSVSNCTLRDVRFSERCWWGFESCVTWRSVDIVASILAPSSSRVTLLQLIVTPKHNVASHKIQRWAKVYDTQSFSSVVFRSMKALSRSQFLLVGTFCVTCGVVRSTIRETLCNKHPV